MGDEKLTINPEQLKSGGFIPQRQKNLGAVRCAIPGGRITSDRLRAIADAADKYGKGVLHVSVRQSLEILYAHINDFENIRTALAPSGQKIASCGKRVRVPTACGGCEYNPRGWTDVQKLAQDVYEKYFGHDMPHKFKISLTGCAIDCMRTREMDLGFQGVVQPKLLEELCTGCTLCVRACEDKALEMRGKLPYRIWDNCILCGDCVRVCPVNAMVPAKAGHLVRVGGKHGKHPHAAYPVARLMPNEDAKVYETIEKTEDWYKKNGKRGERIGNTIDRVGLDNYKDHMKDTFGESLIKKEDMKKQWYKTVAEFENLHA